MAKNNERVLTKTTGDEVLLKKPKVVQLRRKTDKKMRGFTQLLDAIFSVTLLVNEMLCYLRKSAVLFTKMNHLEEYFSTSSFYMNIFILIDH